MPSGQQELLQLIQSSELYRQTEKMATYIVNKMLGKRQKWNKNGEKIYELCMEMKSERELFFDGLCDKLELNKDNVDDTSKNVMMQVFMDGCNFGRLIALYTFCITLCEFCSKNDMESSIDIIIKNTSLTMYTQKEWFEKQGSWVS